MILTATDICTDIEILNVLAIIKSIIELATIVIPVILTILVIIDIIKTVSSQEVDTKKLLNSVSKRIIAAVIIFLIPFIINFAINLIPNGTVKYLDCYENAEKETIETLAVEQADEKLEEFNNIITDIEQGKASYGDGKTKYEEARKAVKAISNDSKQELYESKLKRYKDRLDKLK